MKLTLLIAAFVITTGFVFWKDINGVISPGATTQKMEKDEKQKKKSDKEYQPQVDNGINILERWDLPAELKEISGLAYIDNERFACVQDEEGTIFIYNRSSKQIEKKIPFAGPGDFEGITVKENTAFVVRADGKVFEVDMSSSNGSAKEHSTALTVDHNVEGLCYDRANDRLLLAIKNDEPGNPDYKGIYSFNLQNKSFVKEPVFKIDLDHELLSRSEDKKNKSVMPSAIAVHPVTKEIYITDGPKSRLLVMDNSGNIKHLISLGKEFAQPEGISFSPEGEMFISNEGTKEAGNILKVALQ